MAEAPRRVVGFQANGLNGHGGTHHGTASTNEGNGGTTDEHARCWTFDEDEPALVYAVGTRMMRVDSDGADLNHWRPRDRAVLRALLTHTLTRLETHERQAQA